ncbi:MAG: response regulator transcription factor [Chloroflexota bacterium]
MTKKTKIFLVDDETKLLRLVRANLEPAGYEVLTATDAAAALKLLEMEAPDLVILDIMLPDMDGYEVCQRVREISDVPIIFLTAKAQDTDKVKGLRLGADDYITKPFNIEELLARIENVMRRARPPERDNAHGAVTYGDVSIDFLRRRVCVRGKEIALTLTEYKLLSCLISNAGRVMLHGELLNRVWGPEYHDELEYLRAYILHLRRKIEDDPSQPKYIMSKPGIGYMFAANTPH